ncbi:MAG: carboxypeptidase regulatory-like domain-containing protein [Acidobacteriota bacterium]|nr:carboxypeptidase regulatory-like domain-containing protein [Acidobacteriota bacterium]
MRKALIALCVLLLSVSAFAQTRTGNIYGKVVDPEGNALPGVSVTLTGQFTSQQTAVTNVEGNFRFLSLPPANDYAIRMELSGFRSSIEEGVVVVVGGNTNLTLTLAPGALEEEITVTAVTPMVDSKSTSVGTNVTQDILQSLPTARDPWVILQMAPSIITDRENVGGNESGQQSSYVARGASNYNNNVWSMDGVVITDPAAIGASPSYYDFDAFEEMQIIVGGADVTVQTGGIAMNMVTRRGGNRITFGGRFYVTDEKFQALKEDEVAKIKEKEPLFRGVNKINRNKDYGFNIGLPLIKDRAWFWASYGEQDIKTTTIFGTPDDTLLQNYAAKLNIQPIPQNRIEVFFHIGAKNKFGRSTSASNPEGLYQGGRYYFGSPVVKIQDEHMFGDSLFVSLKYNWYDAGFNLTPMTDRQFNQVPIWDVTDQRYYGSQASRYYVERPVTQYNALINYFNDNLFGASHDVKLGVEYADRNQYVESVWSGNMRRYRRYNTPQIDLTGDGNRNVPGASWNYFSFWRGYFRDQNVKALSVFGQDTISVGRFNILLGLRWDQQTPSLNPFSVRSLNNENGAVDKLMTPQTATALEALLPALDIPQQNHYYTDGSKYMWSIFSPRIGLTWDATGDGKTLVKLSAATYGDYMGTGWADYATPGGASGWMDMWWNDVNGNGMMDLNELFWLNRRGLVGGTLYSPYRLFNDAGQFAGNWDDAAGLYWGGYDYLNPGKTTAPLRQSNPNHGSTRTSEVMLTVERELFQDFAMSAVGTYRKYDQFNWNLKIWKDAAGNTILTEDQSMYLSAGRPPATIPGIGDTKEAKNHDWYYANATYTTYSAYSERMERPDYNMDYIGFDILLNKRLSNKWMANANFTWQAQAQKFGSKGYMNPTNLWAYEGQPQAAYVGGASGKINQHIYSRWMFKASGLYQLPYDINVSGTFNMREGWVMDEYFAFYNYTLPNPLSQSANLRMNEFGTNRLPLFYNLGMRVEKMLRIGDTGRIYVMADIFNVLNKLVENRREQMYYGAYYMYANPALNRFVPWPNFNYLNEVLNPRVVRLGVRFTF